MDGDVVPGETLRRLFDLQALEYTDVVVPASGFRGPSPVPESVVERLDGLFEAEKSKVLAAVEERNAGYFESEFEKLDKWAKDIKHSLEKGLRQMDDDISEARKQYTQATSLQDKVDAQAKIKELESHRNEQRLNLFSEQDKIDQQRDELIQQARGRLGQSVDVRKMFVIRWRIE